MSRVKTQFRGNGRRLINCVCDVVAETGMPIAITEAVEVGVITTPTGGSVTVEYTYSSLRDVIAGTAVWQAWAAGAVAVKTAAVLPGTPSGVRIVNGAGATSVTDISA